MTKNRTNPHLPFKFSRSNTNFIGGILPKRDNFHTSFSNMACVLKWSVEDNFKKNWVCIRLHTTSNQHETAQRVCFFHGTSETVTSLMTIKKDFDSSLRVPESAKFDTYTRSIFLTSFIPLAIYDSKTPELSMIVVTKSTYLSWLFCTTNPRSKMWSCTANSKLTKPT